MKRKIVIMLIIALLPMILCVSAAKAQVVPQRVNVIAWVDKRQYAPGETGTLYITVRNDGDVDYIIKNITIMYPWFGYYIDAWEGNYTIEDEKGLPFSLLVGKIYNTDVTFTVPKDGRASSGTIDIKVYVDKSPWYFEIKVPFEEPYVNVVNPPVAMLLTDMDTWMTSLTVTVVVCTIILAIVVFLSTRKARAPRIVAPPSKAKAE